MQSPTRQPAPLWSRLLLWFGPSLLCLVIYWYGLRAWFQMDDFAWLSLHLDVTDFRSFLSALFRPLAQGTIRPWSERLFFLAGWQIFGMEAAPYRAIVFGTMFGNLLLLSTITRRLTNSSAAAFAAPVLWICNGNLYTPMAWTAAYNQVLCAAFLLAALLVWIRYTETGETQFYVWQWIIFVLGFGALEINLVYPALAALHALCFAPRYVWRTAPMFVVSIAFVIAHRMAAPPQHDDVYRMFYDTSVLSGLATFAGWSVSAHRYAAFRNLELWPFYTAATIVGLALIVLLIRLLVRRNWLPVFCIGWFVAVIAPVLPLRNHRSDYYLTVPVIGLAILGAYGISLAWRSPRLRLVALAVAMAYALPGAWMGRGMAEVWYAHSSRVKHLVRGVAGAAQQHPGQVLVVSGVDNTLFWRAWYDEVFRTLGNARVYLTQDTAPHIEPVRAGVKLAHFYLADTIALQLLEQKKARAYQALSDGRLRETTGLTLARLQRNQLAGPAYLDARSAVAGVHLGEGWWPAEANHRWMSRRAEVELRGPLDAPGELTLRGFCTPGHVENGPLHLSVSVDGTVLPSARIDTGNLKFDLHFPLPASAVGKPLMKIAVSVDQPLILPADGRELGAAFGTFEVTP